MSKITRLSQEDQWESRWPNATKHILAFDPERHSFNGIHHVLKQYLNNKGNEKFLEVGAYPGRYLWYFHEYFGYEPWGVEYVESCAYETQESLKNIGIDGNIIHGDFFELNSDEYTEGAGWDLVASFGFIEHFEEPHIAVSKHLEVAKTGGIVIISAPNHYGWNGNIMKIVDKEKWAQHNCMSLDDLIKAFDTAGGNEILYSGYVGHIGFWNTCIYENAKYKLGRFYPVLRAPLWLIEVVGRWLVPNNKLTSPDFIVVAKKVVEKNDLS